MYERMYRTYMYMYLQVHVQYNKKTTWSYDTDVHIMRVIYLAVMHERGQRECIAAKYSTSMMSPV